MTPRATSALLYDAYGKPMAVSGAWAGTRMNRNKVRLWASGVPGSPDEDLLEDLPKLRSRSRQLMRDNALAVGAINTAVKHVVGTGLTVRPELDREILGWDETRTSEWQAHTARLFNMWCRSKACDATLEQNFWELQDLAYRSTLESGDALAFFGFREHPSSKWGTCIRLVEGDRLSNKDAARDTKRLTGGVQLDTNGLAAMGYWVQDQHPGSRLGVGQKASWTYYPAWSKKGRKLCQHLFIRTRPDQHRGAPYLATVIESLKDLGEYTDGELRAAVISGLYTATLESPAALDENGSPIPPAKGTDQIELGYGATLVLEPGETLKSSTPGRPNQAFDPFVLAVLRQIGTALEIPYEILIQHFTASYSAARAALLELSKFIRRKRAWLAANFCQPAYEAWLEEAVAVGDVEAPGFFDDPLLRMAYCGAEWDGDSMGQIDMLKEVDAWIAAVDANFATKEQATAALFGGDFDRNLERRIREAKAEKAGDLLPTAAQGAGQGAGQSGPGKAKVYPSDDPQNPQEGA